MDVHISYKISKTAAVENLIQQQIQKLERYLRVFRADLVRLRAVVEEATPTGVTVNLNLRLPTGQMAATERGSTPSAAVKAAFEHLVEQLKKHKGLLRNQRSWSRRRAEQPAVSTVPFEETMAAMKPDTVTTGDVAGYIDVNLPRLQRFIERELNYREAQGLLESDQLAVDDVVDEAIADALDEKHDPPERLRLEAWLYRLAMDAIGRLAAQQSDDGHVPLERSHGQPNVEGSDETQLQFHQPDDMLSEEGVISDGAANPEELAAQDELIGIVDSILGQLGHAQREAFILFTVDGFTVEEIAGITRHSPEEVRGHIRAAREYLKGALPLKTPLSEKLIRPSRSA